MLTPRRFQSRLAAARSLLGSLSLLGLAIMGGGCGTEPPPNLLLVTIDTLRADHCSAYGYHRPTTPVLESLAREGALFEPAYAPMATTAPAHATLFTGRYPISHRLVKNGMILAQDSVTLAEILRAARYRTAAVVSSFPLKRRFGFGQGFGTYECKFDLAEQTLDLPSWEGIELQSGFDRRADATTDLALAWLEGRQRDRPFFLWVHYFDPHGPYDPPPSFRNRFPVPEDATHLEAAIARYDEEIAFTDQQLGRLLGALDGQQITEQTLVVVTSDHGEGLNQHGRMGHGIHLYEEAVRVPLVMRWPGRIPAGSRVAGQAELMDLAPTMLDLMGLTPESPEFQGRSLAPLVLRRGSAQAPTQRHVFLQRRLYGSRRVGDFDVRGEKYGVRHGRWKYIEAHEEDTRELFDLEADPEEIRNLAAADPDRARRLSSLIAAWRARYGVEGTAVEDDSAETIDALRALGYVR
jgi:arylsulfatase A-like enzyme